MPLKAYKLYSSFDGWVAAHKHSSYSIQSDLEDCLAAAEDNPVDGLKSYISRLKDMHTEIAGEISEASDWIDYFKRRKKR